MGPFHVLTSCHHRRYNGTRCLRLSQGDKLQHLGEKPVDHNGRAEGEDLPLPPSARHPLEQRGRRHLPGVYRCATQHLSLFYNN